MGVWHQFIKMLYCIFHKTWRESCPNMQISKEMKKKHSIFTKPQESLVTNLSKCLNSMDLSYLFIKLIIGHKATDKGVGESECTGLCPFFSFKCTVKDSPNQISRDFLLKIFFSLSSHILKQMETSLTSKFLKSISIYCSAIFFSIQGENPGCHPSVLSRIHNNGVFFVLLSQKELHALCAIRHLSSCSLMLFDEVESSPL